MLQAFESQCLERSLLLSQSVLDRFLGRSIAVLNRYSTQSSCNGPPGIKKF